MNTQLLICTDLDRTLIPNGDAPESPYARSWFRKLAALPQVTLAYVTGRDEVLVRDAIHEYQLPLPDFVLGDVGSTFYQCKSWDWHHWDDWEIHIAPDWGGRSWRQLATLLEDIPDLRLQESTRQNTHKLSYYVNLRRNHVYLMDQVKTRLGEKGIHSNLIWSIDEPANTGLLDILPARASKRHAIEFLMQKQGFTTGNTVFSGDSGNDLPVMISPVPSVLVANAAAEIREEARHMAAMSGTLETLYIATGGFRGMNGNYAAGILEGVQHYYPEAIDWLEHKS